MLDHIIQRTTYRTCGNISGRANDNSRSFQVSDAKHPHRSQRRLKPCVLPFVSVKETHRNGLARLVA